MFDDKTIANSCFCYKTRAASRTITRLYDDALKSTGLKANQFSMLVAINIQASVSISNLADSLCMERTTLTRNLKPLEKEGLITLSHGVGRIRYASLTTNGKSTLDAAKPLWQQTQDKIQTMIGEQNMTSLSLLLSQINQQNFNV